MQKCILINFPSFYSAFSVLYIFIISCSISVLFSKRRINVNLVDLVKSFPTSIYLQKSASIQPRTSLSKFGGKFNSLFIRLLNYQLRPQRGLRFRWDVSAMPCSSEGNRERAPLQPAARSRAYPRRELPAPNELARVPTAGHLTAEEAPPHTWDRNDPKSRLAVLLLARFDRISQKTLSSNVRWNFVWKIHWPPAITTV